MSTIIKHRELKGKRKHNGNRLEKGGVRRGMYCKIYSGTLHGIHGKIIEVEVDVSNGFPKFDIVGMASSSIQEAKERVRTGIMNAGFDFPYQRITVNLAPANIRKEGVGFDLAIAAGILFSPFEDQALRMKNRFVMGEIALNSEIRPVKGVLALVHEARVQGIKICVVPKENLVEANLVDGISVLGVSRISEFYHLMQFEDIKLHHLALEQKQGLGEYEGRRFNDESDFSEVIGQYHAKRGIEIAVAGMHHILLFGSPGIGKTMMSSRIRTILPELTRDEKLGLTKIYSAADKLSKESLIIEERPFRNPHHSITRAGFIGGGNGKPGEISLAHQGVLMLDEMPEFRKDVIESLREPLEEGKISLSRNHHIFDIPCEFMLVAAMNPCPCGYYPNKEICRCLQHEVDKYMGKISGPILDRIDLRIEMKNEKTENLREEAQLHEHYSSEKIKLRVEQARKIQDRRYRNTMIRYNSQLNSRRIQEYCIPTDKGKRFFEDVSERFQLSQRSRQAISRVARTIADLAGEADISERHIAEAIGYRGTHMGRVME